MKILIQGITDTLGLNFEVFSAESLWARSNIDSSPILKPEHLVYSRRKIG